MRILPHVTWALPLLASAVAFAACSVGTVDGSAGDPPGAAPAAPAVTADGGTVTPLAVRGADFAATRACASCHQSTVAGEGTLSGQLTPPQGGTNAYGSNLTPDPVTGIGTWSVAAIQRAMTANVDDQSRPLCSATPHFKDMSEDEALAIATYLQGLSPVFRAIPASTCGAPSSSGTDAGSQTTDSAADNDSAATSDADTDSGQLSDASLDAAVDARTDASDGGGCGYAGPTVVAACHGCGTHVCQVNGCYGGYWCKLADNTCHPQPLSCP